MWKTVLALIGLVALVDIGLLWVFHRVRHRDSEEEIAQ